MADAAWLVSARGGDNNIKKRKDLLPRRTPALKFSREGRESGKMRNCAS